MNLSKATEILDSLNYYVNEDGSIHLPIREIRVNNHGLIRTIDFASHGFKTVFGEESAEDESIYFYTDEVELYSLSDQELIDLLDDPEIKLFKDDEDD